MGLTIASGMENPISLPAQFLGAAFGLEDAVLGDLLDASFEIQMAFDELAIAEARLTYEYSKAEVEAFEYYLPIAIELATVIKEDPRGTFNSFQRWVNAWITYMSQPGYNAETQGCLNNRPFSAGAATTYPASAPIIDLMTSDGSQSFIEMYQTNLPNLPNPGCQNQWAAYVPLCAIGEPERAIINMAVAICCTDPDALASLSAILFSPDMLTLLQSAQDAINKYANVNWMNEGGNWPLQMWAWDYFKAWALSSWGTSDSTIYYFQLIPGMLDGSFRGPSWLIPQTTGNPPTSPAYQIMLAFLKSNTGLQQYFRTASVGPLAIYYGGSEFDALFATANISYKSYLLYSQNQDWVAATAVAPPSLPTYTLAELQAAALQEAADVAALNTASAASAQAESAQEQSQGQAENAAIAAVNTAKNEQQFWYFFGGLCLAGFLFSGRKT